MKKMSKLKQYCAHGLIAIGIAASYFAGNKVQEIHADKIISGLENKLEETRSQLAQDEGIILRHKSNGTEIRLNKDGSFTTYGISGSTNIPFSENNARVFFSYQR